MWYFVVSPYRVCRACARCSRPVCAGCVDTLVLAGVGPVLRCNCGRISGCGCVALPSVCLHNAHAAYARVPCPPPPQVSDKILLINNLLDKVNEMIIGGGMAFTFKKALERMAIGASLYDEPGAKLVEDIMKKAAANGVKIHLPDDFIIGASVGGGGGRGWSTADCSLPALWWLNVPSSSSCAVDVVCWSSLVLLPLLLLVVVVLDCVVVPSLSSQRLQGGR